eukprot:g78105.t1
MSLEASAAALEAPAAEPVVAETDTKQENACRVTGFKKTGANDYVFIVQYPQGVEVEKSVEETEVCRTLQRCDAE